MHEIARHRGGHCLSKVYVNSKTPLEWKCGEGHTWEAAPANVKNQEQWCPHCNLYLAEEKCRYVIERLVGVDFPKTSKVLPDRLELDGFNSKLDLAFEYHGEHHYRALPLFGGKAAFRRRRTLDRRKRVLCRAAGIRLIVIPYRAASSLEAITTYIQRRLQLLGLACDKDARISFDDFAATKSRLKAISEFATGRGFECLSSAYLGAKVKLRWRCMKCAHEWPATPNDIKNGTGCPACSRRIPLTLQEMQRLAEAKGGKCLSRRYRDSQTKLKWQCKKGHTFWMTPSNVKYNNHWCRPCAHEAMRKRPKLYATDNDGSTADNLRELKAIARIRGGKCLSLEYVNNKTKLIFKCKAGHVFHVSPAAIKNRGSWCKRCAEKEKAVRTGFGTAIRPVAKRHI
ncbi:MAG: zinc-ribbon domain-containing protein [Pirellulales bacterium]